MKFLLVIFAAMSLLGVVKPRGPWSVVIVAGSADQHVFDNATERFQKVLDASGVGSKRFTSDLSRAGIKDSLHIPFATLDGIEYSMTRDRGPCMLYITSHGRRDGSVQVGRQELTPAILSEMITKSCGDKPGVLIVSACFSGNYMRLSQKHPNWTILTASRPDRSSFGCTNDLTYTYWDGCFLGAINSGLRKWSELHLEVYRCARHLEVKLGLEPHQFSEPMFYQGPRSPQTVPW